MLSTDNPTEEQSSVYQAAATDVARGISVIPIAVDAGNGKQPAIAWKPYQERHPSDEELRTWFAVDYCLGRITGSISRIVVVDYDPYDKVNGAYQTEAAQAFAVGAASIR
jgi:hypothetical protein